MGKIKKHLSLIVTFSVIFSWVVVLLFISPHEIVSVIGVEAGYVLVFLTALIGISSLTSASFYTTLFIVSSTGEFNPFLLAAAAVPAAAAGDSLFFLLGLKSRTIIKDRYISRFSNWIDKQPGWTVPIIAYFYTGLTPLPQDILMIATGISGVRFWKILIAILLGNFTFITILSSIIILSVS